MKAYLLIIALVSILLFSCEFNDTNEDCIQEHEGEWGVLNHSCVMDCIDAGGDSQECHEDCMMDTYLLILAHCKDD